VDHELIHLLRTTQVMKTPEQALEMLPPVMNADVEIVHASHWMIPLFIPAEVQTQIAG
jgi:hypothetical protein